MDTNQNHLIRFNNIIFFKERSFSGNNDPEDH